MPKKLILIIAVIIMIGGGGFSGMKVMELGPFAPAPAAGADKEAPKLSKRDRAPRFVDMDPLLIPVFQGNRVAAMVQIRLQLETTRKNRKALMKAMTRLSDAYIRDLNSYIPRLMRQGGEIDVDKVKSRLYIIAERSIGKGLVNNVLIQSIVDRPNR